jgi:hypothetical protein
MARTMGVYMILLADADKLFDRAGSPDTDQLAQWSILQHQHVYTGESVAMRSRTLLHLGGTFRDSGVREFLLALQYTHGLLWSSRGERVSEWELHLTEWLSDNAWVAFRACSYVRDVEKGLVKRMPSPFNIRGNSKSNLMRHLRAERDKFRQHVKETGQFPHRAAKSRSAWLVGHTANHLAGTPT